MPDKKPKATGLACFPQAAARWIALPPGTAPEPLHRSTGATIYVDRSGSMAGYINGANEFERPFQDLVGSLPASTQAIGIPAQYRPFGRKLGDAVPDGKILQRQAFYVCNSGKAAACDNQESRLDLVLAEVAAKPDDMAIMLSDLWFTNSDIQTSGVTALQPLLADILAQGRTIALYGIEAPFSGAIYDLPGAPNTPYTGRHPLYMIVIAGKAEVLALDTQIRRSGSSYLASGLENGKMRRAVFSLDPTSDMSRNRQPINAVPQGALRQEIFESPPGVAIQQFTLKKVLPSKAPQQHASWSGPAEDRFIPGAVWQGPTTPRTRIWLRRDGKCQTESWIEQAPSSEGWSRGDGGQQTLTLDPAGLTARLNSPGVYLVSGELTRTSVDRLNPGDEWMRSTWNLPPERAAAVAGSDPNLFPTLNLSEFARLMENALATAAEREGATIDGFSILVKVEN